MQRIAELVAREESRERDLVEKTYVDEPPQILGSIYSLDTAFPEAWVSPYKGRIDPFLEASAWQQDLS